jgi:hypothetical protein
MRKKRETFFVGGYGATDGAGLSQAYVGLGAALLKHVGGMRAVLRPGDMLYLPALWLHDIETTAVAAAKDENAAVDADLLDDSAAEWPAAVSYACRYLHKKFGAIFCWNLNLTSKRALIDDLTQTSYIMIIFHEHWHVSACIIACIIAERFEPRCLRRPPRPKREKRKDKTAARHRHQADEE